MFILVLLLAGNLAFYQMYGLDGIQRAFDDMMRFRFHIGFDSVYLKYYGAGASLYVIAALLIYGDNQKFRHDAAGDDGGEGVIVADGGDLVGGDGIVLVDDGQCAQLQQTGEGVLDVLTAAGVLDVHAGE